MVITTECSGNVAGLHPSPFQEETPESPFMGRSEKILCTDNFLKDERENCVTYNELSST